MNNRKNIGVIGVPFEFGQNYGGYRECPEYLRQNGLIDDLFNLGNFVENYDDLEIISIENDVQQFYSKNLKTFSVNSQYLMDTVANNLKIHNVLVVLGGDSSVTVGSVLGHCKYHQLSTVNKNEFQIDDLPEVSVISVSLRPNMYTIKHKKSSGHFSKMRNSMILREMQNEIPYVEEFEFIPALMKAKHFGLIGVQEIEEFEKYMIEKYSIKTITTAHLDRLGIARAVDELLGSIDPKKANSIHLSINIDVFDPLFCVSSTDPLLGGFTLRECIFLCETLNLTGRLKVVEITGFNPHMGSESENNKSCDVIKDCITTAVGKCRKGLAHINPEYYSWRRSHLSRRTRFRNLNIGPQSCASFTASEEVVPSCEEFSFYQSDPPTCDSFQISESN